METTIEKLLSHMYIEELSDEYKERIIKVDEPPFPGVTTGTQSSLDWFKAMEEFKNELSEITKHHNQDNEKLKETIKCIVNMPVVASFSNNGDENTWIVKMEVNTHRMMELFNKRHKYK